MLDGAVLGPRIAATLLLLFGRIFSLVDIYRFTCINSADLFGIAEGEGEGVDMDMDTDMDMQRGGSSSATVLYHASSLTTSYEIITRPFTRRVN
jgi:hypothetical protein